MRIRRKLYSDKSNPKTSSPSSNEFFYNNSIANENRASANALPERWDRQTGKKEDKLLLLWRRNNKNESVTSKQNPYGVYGSGKYIKYTFNIVFALHYRGYAILNCKIWIYF